MDNLLNKAREAPHVALAGLVQRKSGNTFRMIAENNWANASGGSVALFKSTRAR